jgi:hypothetical protein
MRGGISWPTKRNTAMCRDTFGRPWCDPGCAASPTGRSSWPSAPSRRSRLPAAGLCRPRPRASALKNSQTGLRVAGTRPSVPWCHPLVKNPLEQSTPVFGLALTDRTIDEELRQIIQRQVELEQELVALQDRAAVLIQVINAHLESRIKSKR